MANEPTNSDPQEAKKVEEGTDEAKTGESAKEPTVADLQKQIESVTKERDDFKAKSEKIATKLGTQSHEVKLLRDITDLQKNQPRELIRKMADKAGLGDVYFGADKPSPDKTVGLNVGDLTDEQLKAVEIMHAKGKQEMRTEVQSLVSPIFEQLTASKYHDWDKLAETRTAVITARNTGLITETEASHLIARGLHLDAALNDAKEQGKQEYITSLQKKDGGQIEGSGATVDATGKEAMLDWTEIAKELNRERV